MAKTPDMAAFFPTYIMPNVIAATAAASTSMIINLTTTTNGQAKYNMAAGANMAATANMASYIPMYIMPNTIAANAASTATAATSTTITNNLTITLPTPPNIAPAVTAPDLQPYTRVFCNNQFITFNRYDSSQHSGLFSMNDKVIVRQEANRAAGRKSFFKHLLGESTTGHRTFTQVVKNGELVYNRHPNFRWQCWRCASRKSCLGDMKSHFRKHHKDHMEEVKTWDDVIRHATRVPHLSTD